MIINKYKLLENLCDTYCVIGRSEIHGIGVVAIRDIPKGIDPLPCIAPDYTISLTEEELSILPKEIIKKIKDTFVRVNKKYHVCNLGLNSLGVKFHINHCESPNIAVNEGTATQGYNPFITLKKIKKGEELCWDYKISNGDNILNQFKFLKNEQ